MKSNKNKDKNCWQYMKIILSKVLCFFDIELLMELAIPEDLIRSTASVLVPKNWAKAMAPMALYKSVKRFEGGPRLLLLAHLLIKIKKTWERNVREKEAYMIFNDKRIDDLRRYYKLSDITEERVKVRLLSLSL